MNKLLIKLASGFITSAVVLMAYIYLFADGHTDDYYLRFTTPQPGSLILGTSRSAQALEPAVFNDSDLNFDKPMYNFSFSLLHSPYGPAYLRAVKRKLKPEVSNGLFILSVDPWSISEVKGRENMAGHFPEAAAFIGGMNNCSANPNFEYLFKYLGKPFYTLVEEHWGNKNTCVTPTGRLEVRISMNEEAIASRLEKKHQQYSLLVQDRIPSDRRLGHLRQMIDFLNERGRVILVRLPIHPRIRSIEDSYMPDFDQIINQITAAAVVEYINLIDESGNYQTTDGSHLYAEAGIAVTEKICEIIRFSQVP